MILSKAHLKPSTFRLSRSEDCSSRLHLFRCSSLKLKRVKPYRRTYCHVNYTPQDLKHNVHKQGNLKRHMANFETSLRAKNSDRCKKILHNIVSQYPHLENDKEILRAKKRLSMSLSQNDDVLAYYNKLGSQKEPYDFYKTLSYFSSANAFWIVERLIVEYENETKTIDSSTCAHIYNAYMKIRKPEKAQPYLLKIGDDLDHKSASALLKSFKSDNNAERLTEVYNLINSKGLVDEHNMNVYIEALARCNEIDKALEVLNSNNFFSFSSFSGTLVTLLKALGDNQRIKEIDEVYDKTTNANVIDSVNLNAFAQVYARVGKISKAMHILYEVMPAHCIYPIPSVYTSLIEVFSYFSQEDALYMFEEMKRMGLTSSLSYYLLIRLYILDNNWEKALMYYRESKESNLLHSKSMFLMISFAPTIEESNEFFEDFSSQYPTVSSIGITTTLDFCRTKRNFNFEYIEYLYNRWFSEYPDVIPDVKIFTTMIEAAATTGHPEEAFKYYYKSRECKPKGLDRKVVKAVIEYLVIPYTLDTKTITKWEHMSYYTSNDIQEWDELIKKWYERLHLLKQIDWEDIESHVFAS